MEGSSSHGDFLRRYMIPCLLVRAILCCIGCEVRADGMKWHLEIKGPGTWNPETGDLVWLCHTPPSDPCPGLSFPGFQGAQIVLTGLPCAACLGGISCDSVSKRAFQFRVTVQCKCVGLRLDQ